MNSEPLTPVIYNVAITTTNTEYSQVLPGSCRHFSVQCSTSADLRIAFTAGLVAASTAPYGTVKAGTAYTTPEKMDSPLGGLTLYLANTGGSVVAEIIAWY